MDFLDNSDPRDISEIPLILQQVIDRLIKLEDPEKGARRISETINKSIPIYLPKVHQMMEDFRNFKEKVQLKMDITNESGVNTKAMQDDVNKTTLDAIKYNVTNIKSEVDYLKVMFTTEKLQKIEEGEQRCKML